MGKDKKPVEQITAMDVDFAKWYTDIVKKADLVDYSGVKGCMIIRPYGYAIWENIQRLLNDEFKKTGHENVYMPLFIPESLLNKEKEHVEGFAPEVAWVTHGGGEELTERMCVRPTSEVLFCDHYKDIVKSYRDLPKLYNQWCSVVRWEKTTRPFLRTREFLWQEGHTIHATAEEAEAETLQMLGVYADFYEKKLGIPVVCGKKTDKEKFAGAESTYTVEALMHDGKALQGGTSHNFGDGFSRAFDIQYLDCDNRLKHCYQTSWGTSTRMIGAIIMAHGDDSGLVLPPEVAPIQIAVVPIAQHKEGVLEAAQSLANELGQKFRVKLDASDRSPGWKFAEYEMKGVPLRIEIGPLDIERAQCVMVRRDSGEKLLTPLKDAVSAADELLRDFTSAIYKKAYDRRANMTHTETELASFIETAKTKPGFIRAMWCGDVECELKMKELADVTSRCMPFNEELCADSCICCGKPASKLLYWGKAY